MLRNGEAGPLLLNNVRRLHHVDRVIVRSINVASKDNDSGSVDCYYTLTLPGNDTPFYTSDVLHNTPNPAWDFIKPEKFTQPIPQSCKRVSLHVRRLRRGATAPDISKDTLVLHEDVDMSELVWLHDLSTNTYPVAPANSVFFFLPDGVYSFASVAEFVQQRVSHADSREEKAQAGSSNWMRAKETVKRNAQRKRMLKQANRVSANDIVNNANRIFNSQTALAKRSQECQDISDRITARLQGITPQVESERVLKAREKRIQHLKSVLAKERERLAADKVRVRDLRQSLGPEAKDINRHTDMLLMEKQHLKLHHADQTLASARSTLARIKRKLSARRRKILSQLMSVYPVTGDSKENGAHSIRGLPLPSKNLTSLPEEDVATALGYAAHLVFLLAKYSSIPLRYRIDFRGSRSTISDDVQFSHALQNDLPLYFKGVDERRFECACILLNNNIQHMMAVLKANPKSEHAGMLGNLAALLEHQVPL